MTDSAPTLGEVVRRLDDVSRRLDEITARVEAREARMEAAFVRKDVFEAVQVADATQVRGIESEVHTIIKRLDLAEERRRTDRALLFTSLIAPLLLMLIGAVVLTNGGS